eukprot:6174970-Pleurochrysis_carterae.AAC.2
MAAWRALKRVVDEAPVLPLKYPTCPSQGRRGRVACTLRATVENLTLRQSRRPRFHRPSNLHAPAPRSVSPARSLGIEPLRRTHRRSYTKILATVYSFARSPGGAV